MVQEEEAMVRLLCPKSNGKTWASLCWKVTGLDFHSQKLMLAVGAEWIEECKFPISEKSEKAAD